MLNFESKKEIFKKILDMKNDSYGDFMKDEIYFHFFENENDLTFLNKYKNFDEIEEKVNFLISKMIMLEDKEGLSEIIHHYT
ncbi:hypothetical protein [Flavobacterium sp.]|jgi:hypothetical protein|uniref:hypothetical protein n=1 Tax=Flavobacterium sp. TaxID=239 RepID=UPI0037C164F2